MLTKITIYSLAHFRRDKRPLISAKYYRKFHLMMGMYKSLICFRIGIIKSTENFFLEEPMSGEIDTITCFICCYGWISRFPCYGCVRSVWEVCEVSGRYSTTFCQWWSRYISLDDNSWCNDSSVHRYKSSQPSANISTTYATENLLWLNKMSNWYH